MAHAELLTPKHKAIRAYYDTLKRYTGQKVEHELAVRSAFQNLLADTAKLHDWMLIPELSSQAGPTPVHTTIAGIRAELDIMRVLLPESFDRISA